MQSLARLSLILVAVGTWCLPASAFWFDTTCQYMDAGYRRNVLWPYPYVCPDRAAAAAPFATMVHNGWRRQNLLGPQHFDAETNALNTAGQLKVRWIVTQAPEAFRNVFIERSLDSEVTAERIEAASKYATQVSQDSVSPTVQESHLMWTGRPAATVDATQVRYFESMPPPVLPSMSGSGGGGTP